MLVVRRTMATMGASLMVGMGSRGERAWVSPALYLSLSGLVMMPPPASPVRVRCGFGFVVEGGVVVSSGAEVAGRRGGRPRDVFRLSILGAAAGRLLRRRPRRRFFFPSVWEAWLELCVVVCWLLVSGS